MIRNKRIIISGGAGFLGSVTAELLSARNRVTVIDDLSTGVLASLRNCPCRFIRARAWGQRALDAVRRTRPDYIVHLAANAYIKTSVEKPSHDFENNAVQTFRLLEFVRHVEKKPKILLASSAAVHGRNIAFPMRETDHPAPVSPYGVSKLSLELYGSVYHQVYGVPVQTVRFYPMYGPRQKKQVVYDLMKKLCGRGDVLEVIGTGREVRDFLYVEDAARGIAAVLKGAKFDGSAVNLCTGRGVTIERVAREIMRAMKIKKRLLFTQRLRMGDVHKMVGSTVRIRKLGFRPLVAFEEGIKRTVKWFLGD